MHLRHRKTKRSGLSLLEVLTALAIFMLSVVVISQMVDSASRTAFRAQKQTKAALLAESKMAELAWGIEPLESTGQQDYADPEPGWSYSVTVTPENWSNTEVDGQSLSGLSTVHVTVVWTNPRGTDAIEYTLSRMLLDPRLRAPAPAQQTTSGTESGTGTGKP
jgi:type II secretion system protein I